MKKGHILQFDSTTPRCSEKSFVAKGAFVIGDVFLDDFSSIWYNSVLRADIAPIRIGSYSNIQDNSTIHVDHNGETSIGNYVTVGHNVNLHNVLIHNNSLIGNGAILLDYAEIGSNVIIGAGSVIPPRKKIPDNVLVMGNPFTIVREVTPDEVAHIKENALFYWDLACKHAAST